ncbi:hypothetical protein QN277_018792 [Acacia crassicarpa]|uniref:Uncharacterized protein n=1 Tax=Acacia crassicarpa TaxID=499986 RepID=A0AAE1JWP9_9FABA|nr:hypothetical protein QN277_018792 [Acacia crassicarpa]
MARPPLSYQRSPLVNRYRRMGRVARKTVNPQMVARRLNPDPVYPPPVSAPQFVPVRPVHANDLGLPYNPYYLVEHLHDPEPEYHLGSEDPDNLYDPNSVPAIPLNAIPAPGAPTDSHHSSVGDNFDYIDVADLLDENVDSEYEIIKLADLEEEHADNVADLENANVENLRYVLDDNRDLTEILYNDFVRAG